MGGSFGLGSRPIAAGEGVTSGVTSAATSGDKARQHVTPDLNDIGELLVIAKNKRIFPS